MNKQQLSQFYTVNCCCLFSTWYWVNQFLLSSSTCSRTKPGTGFLQNRCPSCHLINRVKAQKQTQSTDPNQRKSLISPPFLHPPPTPRGVAHFYSCSLMPLPQ